MNPMVDMAFLLVSFFMLTTTFKVEEAVQVSRPSSFSETKLPESDIVTITIADDGRIFFNLDGKFHRYDLLDRMGQYYEQAFSEEAKEAFSLMTSFGMEIEQMESFLEMDPDERKRVEQSGIPVDSLNNQLKHWVVFSRVVNPRVRVAINADRKTEYAKVEKVVNTLLDNNIFRFSLVTELEEEI